MATATITLHKLIQDSQDYGSDDEHMISRVFFDLEINGVKYEGLHADVKQPVGSLIETTPLEISRPANYTGAFNYEAFQAIVERYFRSLIGSSGSGIHITGGGNIRMRNNTFIKLATADFEVQAAGGSW